VVRFIPRHRISDFQYRSSSHSAGVPRFLCRYCFSWDRRKKPVLNKEEHEMNAITSRMTQLTMIAAVLAAGVIAQPSNAANPEAVIVRLPTVVVIGKRIPVVQLERVVVTAKRAVAASAVVAQRGAHGSAVQSAERG
jgi:hypothetical protein